MRHAVLLTPTLSGHDGLSCLARQLRDGLSTLTGQTTDVLSLENGRAAFAMDVVRTASSGRLPDLAVVAHLHLLPAVWPLLWRGTRVVPVLVGIEGWTPLTPPRARVLRRLPRAIAISHHTEREFKRANPEFATLPVDVCWPATPAPHAVAPVGEAAAPFALIVGRMARDERYKGHDELIDLWPRVLAAVPTGRLVIAGAGNDMQRLQDRVIAMKMTEAIRFEEQVSSARLAQLYQDCAFLVLPSRREGFGYVLLEAMQAGRACIGGTGAAEEIIERGVTGLVVDPAATDDLVHAIVQLFQNPEQRNRMGAAGQARAADVFSMSRFVSDLEQAIARC
jgi:phosphatidylinositol alpha-1,6-mannosyltransferase